MEKHTEKQGWPLALFTIGVFMAGLDNGIIGTALTTINEFFGVSPSWGAWTITLYTLGIAISVPIIGKLSDRYGRKRMFLIEITLFGLGSLFVALSPNFTALLLSRFIQAIGGGGIFIIGSSHILATMPKEKQGKALGMLGSMHGLSAIIGPNVGAIILQLTGSWQWMFLINLPIALFLLLFGMLKIKESHTVEEGSLDLTGTMLLMLSILSFMLGTTQLEGKSFAEIASDLKVVILFLNAIFLFILLLLYERRLESDGGDPILSVSLLSSRFFQMILFLSILSGGFLAGIIFIPSYVQQVLQVPVEKAGFWITPFVLMSGAGAGIGGALTDRIGARQTVIISGSIAGIGFALFPFWVDSGGTFLLASVIAGVGFGFLLGAPLNVLTGQSAPEGEKGTALGLLSLTRQIGLTIFPMIFASFIANGMFNVPNVIDETFGEQTIEVTAETSSTQEQYQDVVAQIKTYDIATQHKMFKTISALLKASFDQMFLTSPILAILVTVCGLFLIRMSPKQ